jgi:type VI protein secretion system component VasF
MSNSQSALLAEREWLSVGRSTRDPDAQSGQRVKKQSIRLSTDCPHASNVEEAQVTSERPPIGRQLFGFSRFSIAVLIGIGAALGWQSYGDAARKNIVEQIPTLAWLFAVSKMKSPVVAATSPELLQQLMPLTFSLEIMRRSVDQLAAKEEQMAQNIAALQAVDEDVRQKVSSPPPSPTPQAAPVEQAKPRQPKAQALHRRSAPRPPPAGTGTGFVSR